MGISLMSACAHAETISATASVEIVSDNQITYYRAATTYHSYVGNYPSKEALCEPLAASIRDHANDRNDATHHMFRNGYGQCLGVNSDGKVMISCDPKYCITGGISYHTAAVKAACSTGSSWNGADCVRTFYSCPGTGGWSLSSDQQSCDRPDCSAGYDRDPITGACLAPCPTGQERNMSTMQCEASCTSPLIRTEGNTCDCPAPLTLTDGNACIGQEAKELGEQSCGSGPAEESLK